MRAYSKGFTFIELMITIAILCILLFFGISLTRAWIDQAKIYQAIHATNSALLHARTLALKNSNNQSISMTIPATAVCIVNASLVVYQIPANADTPCSSSNTVLKTFSLAETINLYAGNTSTSTFSCVAFNALGIMISTSNHCAVESTYTVVSNNESKVFSID